MEKRKCNLAEHYLMFSVCKILVKRKTQHGFEDTEPYQRDWVSLQFCPRYLPRKKKGGTFKESI